MTGLARARRRVVYAALAGGALAMGLSLGVACQSTSSAPCAGLVEHMHGHWVGGGYGDSFCTPGVRPGLGLWCLRDVHGGAPSSPPERA